MSDISLDYRDKFLKRQLQYDRKFRLLFGKVADDFSRLSADPNIRFSKAFKFNDAINKKIDIIIEAFHKDVLDLTELEIEKAWGLSNEKTDLIVKDYLKTITKIRNRKDDVILISEKKASTGSIYRTYKVGNTNIKVRFSDHLANISKEYDADIGLNIKDINDKKYITDFVRQVAIKKQEGQIILEKGITKNILGYDEIEVLPDRVILKILREKKYHKNQINSMFPNTKKGAENRIEFLKTARREGDCYYRKGFDTTELSKREFSQRYNVRFGIKKDISLLKESKISFSFLNIPALKAFISGKDRVVTLSESIWEIAAQLRGELKIHLGLGLLNGDSASVISRRIRQYLKDPEALFRRVRDAKGRLIASKAMIANAPGQGKYNSAFKNAMRVTRSNTNMAYLYADHLRWQQLNMVTGVKVSLSAQHRIYDICDELVGTYPKTFVYIGFHPQCLCTAVPILMPKDDFQAYLKGTKPLKAEQITEYPTNFKKFWKENFDKYSNYKTMPFIMEENLEAIKNVIK